MADGLKGKGRNKRNASMKVTEVKEIGKIDDKNGVQWRNILK